MKTLDYKGHTIKIETHHDAHMGPPWKENDGHGIISDWTGRDKRPGEIVLCTDHGARRFYDLAETLKIAKRDGWELSQESTDKLALKLGRRPTAKQILEASVQSDFDYCYGWANDQWHWVGYSTEIETPDGETIDGDSCCGFDDEKYMLDEAIEQAKYTVDQLALTQEQTQLAETMP